jgi:hypothetical protein
VKVHKETPVRAAACQLSHDYCGDLAQLEGATVSEAVVAARRLTSDALLRFTARAPFARRRPTNDARAEDGDFHEGEWRGVSRKLSARRQEKGRQPQTRQRTGVSSLMLCPRRGRSGAARARPEPEPAGCSAAPACVQPLRRSWLDAFEVRSSRQQVSMRRASRRDASKASEATSKAASDLPRSRGQPGDDRGVAALSACELANKHSSSPPLHARYRRPLTLAHAGCDGRLC